MKKTITLLCILLPLLSVFPSGTLQTRAAGEKTVSCEKRLKAMSLEEKVGQLFIVRPEALAGRLAKGNTHAVTKICKTIQKNIKKYNVGGVAMFSQNITTPGQITKLNKDLQKSAKTGLFICVDEEGGSVARIANNRKFKVKKYSSMQSVGKTGKTSKAKAACYTIGRYLKKYGFNLDFAPVADVNTNPKNIVIGKRAFGSSPGLVSKMVDAGIKGFHKAGVMTCVKHFPGHGDTKGDTHTGYVSVNRTWAQLNKRELLPFKKAITSPTDLVMVAHITADNVTGDELPASLSRQMITKRLRGTLKYKGVVITDTMEMGAIVKNYSSGESAVMAIQAGADIILMPQNFTEAYRAVCEAVRDGKISEKRLDESVLRILRLKEKYGLLK